MKVPVWTRCNRHNLQLACFKWYLVSAYLKFKYFARDDYFLSIFLPVIVYNIKLNQSCKCWACYASCCVIRYQFWRLRYDIAPEFILGHHQRLYWSYQLCDCLYSDYLLKMKYSIKQVLNVILNLSCITSARWDFSKTGHLEFLHAASTLLSNSLILTIR